jgi:hypothetical protein
MLGERDLSVAGPGPRWEKHNAGRAMAVPVPLWGRAMPCEMTGGVTREPQAFLPSWPGWLAGWLAAWLHGCLSKLKLVGSAF